MLLIGPLGTKFSEMLVEIHTFSIKKIHLKMSSEKWRPFCLGLNVLIKGAPDVTFDSVTPDNNCCHDTQCHILGGAFRAKVWAIVI